MEEFEKDRIKATQIGDGAHEERDELVPLVEPDEHGRIRPPEIAPAPKSDADVRTSTVVRDRYASSGTKPASEAAVAGDVVKGSEPIVRPGFPGSNALIVIGAILTLGAVGLAGYFAPNHAVARCLSTLYDIAVHTGTGIVALMVAALFTERKFNDPKLGAARMYVLVALLYTIVNTSIPIPTKTDEWILGLCAYILALWGLFRLPRHDLTIIGVTHAGLWLIVKFGATLEAFIAARPAA